ncbi:MAG: hypothetical protein KDA84_12090, partial [Planctomycetaceae bacterium]|nr:hypothetical protein [Planctomycetaceae bacterium]
MALTPWKKWGAAILVSVLVLGGIFHRHILGRYYLNRSQLALYHRQPALALTLLEKAESYNTPNGAVPFWSARAYRRLGKFEKVHDQLLQAERAGFDPERIQRERWLTLAQSGRMREVELHLPTLLTSPGEDGPEICEAFVNGYFSTYRFDQGLQILDVWKKDFPDDPQPYVFSGQYYRHLEDWKKAEEAFREG